MNSKRIVVNGHLVPPGGLSNIYAPSKMYKEDGSEVNTADMIEALYRSLVVNKNAGVDAKLTGSNVADTQSSGLIPGMGFNGTTYDRWRNNSEGTLLVPAVRSTNTTSPLQTNHNAKGVMLHVNITAAPNSASTLIIWIRAIDPVANSGNFGVMATLITAAGSTLQSGTIQRIVLYPGATASPAIANFLLVSAPLPRRWDCYVNHNGAGNWEYSVGYSLIL
jgi:hypothetical protein